MRAAVCIIFVLCAYGVSSYNIARRIGTRRISCLRLSDDGLNELNRFQWRDQTLYLKDKRMDGQAPPQGLLFDLEDKYPGLVATDPSYEHLEILPLLPESAPAFPGSRHFLYINEMKFREMFSEMFKSKDKRMIRCFIDGDGAIEPVAVICRIVEHKVRVCGNWSNTVWRITSSSSSPLTHYHIPPTHPHYS